MFNVGHQGRKYVPARSATTDDPPLSAVRTVHVSKSLGEPPEATWPPPAANMRVSKANKGAAVVRVVRRHASPQPPRLEHLEAAWCERAQPGSPTSPERRDGEADAAEGHGGGPPRGRKKGFRPPDVRTIFSPGEKDPRVAEESGEGHCFEAGGDDSWCDVCCHYIFQQGLTCAGESRTTGGGRGGLSGPYKVARFLKSLKTKKQNDSEVPSLVFVAMSTTSNLSIDICAIILK